MTQPLPNWVAADVAAARTALAQHFHIIARRGTSFFTPNDAGRFCVDLPPPPWKADGGRWRLPDSDVTYTLFANHETTPGALVRLRLPWVLPVRIRQPTDERFGVRWRLKDYALQPAYVEEILGAWRMTYATEPPSIAAVLAGLGREGAADVMSVYRAVGWGATEDLLDVLLGERAPTIRPASDFRVMRLDDGR